jgi:hypothetical protein
MRPVVIVVDEHSALAVPLAISGIRVCGVIGTNLISSLSSLNSVLIASAIFRQRRWNR